MIRSGERRWPSIVGRLAWGMAGFVVPPLFAIGFLAAHGALDDFWSVIVEFNATYAGRTSGVGKAVTMLAGHWGRLVVLASFGAFAARRRKAVLLDTLFWTLIVSNWLAVVWQGKYWPYHWTPMIGLLAMGLIGYGAVRATQDTWIYSPLFWVFVAASALACLAGIFRKTWTRPVSALAGFLVVFALAWVTNPFNGELGRFSPATNTLLKGQTVQVPSNFNGHFERYEFIIPGARIVAYFAEQPVDYQDVDALFKTSRYVLVQRRIGQLPCTQCRILDERWDLRSRQDEKDGTMAAFKTPETYWYAKEYLVERLTP